MAQGTRQTSPTGIVPTAIDAAVPACRVLIVDDHRDSAETLAMLLGLLGHDVRQIYDSEHAVAAALEFAPHAIFLDIGMPQPDGYEVARQIRAERVLDSARLVALTGFGGDEHRDLSLAAGFDYHLVKPVGVAVIEPILVAAHANRARR